MTGSFEINLDRHKLRTPLGNIVQIPSEPIALGVAEEWRTQDKVINRYNMQLVSGGDDDDVNGGSYDGKVSSVFCLKANSFIFSYF